MPDLGYVATVTPADAVLLEDPPNFDFKSEGKVTITMQLSLCRIYM